MAARKPIVVVGSVNADLILESRLPLPGETISATGGGVTVAGGKGANQAATAGKLGYSTAFIGQTGRDAAGGMLREALGACGVSLQHTPAVAAPTGQAVIILQPDGENSIIIVGGANVAWQAPDAAALDAVRAARGDSARRCALTAARARVRRRCAPRGCCSCSARCQSRCPSPPLWPRTPQACPSSSTRVATRRPSLTSCCAA